MILVFGSHGQLGQTLQQQMGQAPEHVFLHRDSLDYCGDITNTAGLTETLMDLKPEFIINAAAYTAVDRAESEPDQATMVNAKAPAVMAQIAAKINACLVHYSTDYVFDGHSQTPYQETDTCNPLSVYGQTKRQGEEGILASGCRHYILRSSWVYSPKGKNFLNTMLRLAQTQEEIRVVNDQWGVPTSTELLANCTLDLMNLCTPGYGSPKDFQPPASGIYHCTPAGKTNWFEYAQLVIQSAQALGYETRVKKITPVPSAQYPTAAKRPGNSLLNSQKLQKTLGQSFSDWQEDVMMAVGQACLAIHQDHDHE
jgi:dTDP-4-dehydrorhamnose reductase